MKSKEIKILENIITYDGDCFLILNSEVKFGCRDCPLKSKHNSLLCGLHDYNIKHISKISLKRFAEITLFNIKLATLCQE